jgi:hypothetical protein
MTSKFLRSFLAIAVLSDDFRLGPNRSTSAPAGASTSPSPAAPVASAPVVTGTGTKLGTINIEQAVMGTNEGQRDFEASAQEAGAEAERTESSKRRTREFAETTADPGRQAE